MVDITEGDQDAGSTSRAPGSRVPLLVTAAATLTALVLGLFRLGRLSLWYDEAQTVGTVDRPLGDALWRISHWEVNQSPFYLLVAGWIRLGDSEAFLRFLSVAAFVGTVPLLFLLGRRLADARVGALAAVLFALHGFTLEWAQQLRGYALVTCLVTLATLLLVRLLEAPSTRRALAYGLVAALAAYTQFFALLVIGVHVVTVALVRPRGPDRRPFFVAAATLAVALAPLALFLLTQEGDPIYWVEDPSGGQVLDTLSDLSGGGRGQLLAYGVAGALGVAAAFQAVRSRGWSSAWRLLLPVLWVVLPLGFTVLSSATVKPLLVSRFLLVVVPGLILVAAIGVVHLVDHAPRGVAVLALGGLLVASLLGVRATVERPPFEDWRNAVALVADGAEPGDVVVTVPGRAVHAVRYYADPAAVPEEALRSPGDLGDLSGDQVWVLSRRREEAVPNDREVFELALEEQFRLAEETAFHGIEVRRYERR